jgi:RES domain-containing protein
MLGRGRTIGPSRFNEANGARVLYLANDYEVALYEAQALKGATLSARILFPVQVDLKAVVDLRRQDIQNLLSTHIGEITANFRRLRPQPSPTQELGEACEQLGDIDGLLYQSAINQNWTNLAVFESSLPTLGSKVWVEDPANALSPTIDPDLELP